MTKNFIFSPMKELFKDMIVVELASVLAGPAVGMFFAELGAKVIKFENATTEGDVTRKWKLNSESSELPYSAYYCAVNYGKKVVMSDLKKEAGRKQLIKWVEKADIVIANFKSTSAEKLRLDYNSLKAVKEDLIYAQLDGYPEPMDKVAFDVVLQAETGYLSMSGQSNGASAKMPVALIDLMAAHQLKEGILIALLKKMKTGDGSLVRTSLYETAIASLANQATNWLMNNHIPQKMGTLHPNIAPYGEIFKTLDEREIVLAVGTDQQFTKLCEALDIEEIAANDIYQDNNNRVKNRIGLAAILSERIKLLTSTQLAELCKMERIPMGIVQTLPQVFENKMAVDMILTDEDEWGNNRYRVKTVAFSVT